ncbi:MAG: deazaflavin-dependent oxidoreductase (nitroreductase family) [Candidatus Binatia bacterium]
MDVTKLRKEDVKPIPKGVVPFMKRVMHVMTRVHVWIFTTSQGRLGKNFAGAPCCMITMTGKKTGLRRTIPLIHLPYKDGVLLIASQGGLDFNPTWYWNLLADPHIDVIADGTTRKMLAHKANDAEKAEVWPQAVAVYADFDQYQARTDRDIPVFICTPE